MACLIAACWACLPVASPALVLSAERQQSTGGVVQLSWVQDGRQAVLRRAADQPGMWSGPVEVGARHHGPVRTSGLFGLGALVFLSLIGLIFPGTAREKRRG